MKDDEIDLRSVNWEHGMLLTPQHLLRQEHYIDSLMSWTLRYCTNAYGLIGAGTRIGAAERGAAKYDPIIEVYDSGEELKISITQCRGISPSGEIIDIDPAHAIHQSFSKAELEGHNDLGIFVVCNPHNKFVESEPEDTNNPQIKSSRYRRYQVKLDINGAEASHSLKLGLLRKPQNSMRYEKAGDFIPACATLVSYSGIKRVWEGLSHRLSQIADRYTELYNAIVEYIKMANQRNISSREDEETLQFVGRMVVTLEACAYKVLDPMQSPQAFFQELYRAIRSAAIYLNLSPPTRDYFRQLAEYGETEFSLLLEQEQQALLNNRELTLQDNLNFDAQRIDKALHRLQRLEEALEGKYWDYRMSSALEALNFFFDRRSDPPALYQSIAKPSRPQLFGEELTFVFAPLKLEGQTYRLVLISTSDALFIPGESIGVEIAFNPGSGQATKTLYFEVQCDISGQRNFAIDFDTPSDIHTISDLRVILNNVDWPVRSCLIYLRRRVIQPSESVVSSDTQPPETFSSPLPKREGQGIRISEPYAAHRYKPEPGRRNRLVEPSPKEKDLDRDPNPRRRRLE